MTNINLVDFSLVLQVIDIEHLNTLLFVHDGWILLLDKLIFKSLATDGQPKFLGQFQ